MIEIKINKALELSGEGVFEAISRLRRAMEIMYLDFLISEEEKVEYDVKISFKKE